MMNSELKGIWPALLIPVDEKGEVEVKELEKIIQLFLDQELYGLYILGSTGQGFLFSEEERIRISRRMKYGIEIGLPNPSLRFSQIDWKDKDVNTCLSQIEDFVNTHYD